MSILRLIDCGDGSSQPLGSSSFEGTGCGPLLQLELEGRPLPGGGGGGPPQDPEASGCGGGGCCCGGGGGGCWCCLFQELGCRPVSVQAGDLLQSSHPPLEVKLALPPLPQVPISLWPPSPHPDTGLLAELSQLLFLAGSTSSPQPFFPEVHPWLGWRPPPQP